MWQFHTNSYCSHKELIIALVLFAIGTSGATAQMLEEIIVTAQKREQAIQDVPITITAFSGEQMERLGFQESQDIINMTPGVTTAGNIGGQFFSFNIRGVNQSDFADVHESPNAVYIDQVYLSFVQANRFGLFDSERVEILKGPQGTLYGRNATGGLVHYITRKPTDTFEAYAKLTGGSFGHTRFEGALSGPLSDNLKARAAILYNRHDEIYENQIAGVDDEWGDLSISGRVHLLWNLSDDAELLITGFASDSENSTAPWQPFPTITVVDADGNITNTLRPAPTETRAGIGPGGADFCPLCLFGPLYGGGPRPVPGADAFGFIDTDLEDERIFKDFAVDDTAQYSSSGVTGTLTWDFSNVTLTSVTDYRTGEKDGIKVDVDASPADALNFRADAKNDQFSQEIRLSRGGDKAEWLLGAYFLSYDLDAMQGIFGLDPATNTTGFLGGVQFVSPVEINTDSLSLFGHLEYDLTENLGLTTGLRVIQEDKDFTHRAQIWLLDDTVIVPDLEGFPGTFLPNAQALNIDDTLWAGKIQLNWRPSDDLLIYGGVSRGVKAGGFNQQLGGVFAIDNFEYDDEELTAGEIGFKSTVFGGTTRFNGALYYYAYDDFQAHAANNLNFFVVNADADIQGVEFEVMAQPTTGLDLHLSVSYIDAEVQDVPLATGPLGSGEKLLIDVEPTFTPELQVAGLARYEWPAFSGKGTMAVQADFAYSDTSFTNITNFDSTEMDSWFLGNLRLSYTTADNRWQAEVFVENVGDELIEQLGFDLSTLAGSSLRSYLPPRWYGASVRYNWQ
jgi:iron complex outermembrane receptor protein